MNHIYDISVNFNTNLYEVFEWNKNDKITRIKKIPIFRVTSSDMKNFITKKITIEKSFLDKIYKKTEMFDKNVINYAFIVTDRVDAIAIKVTDKILYSRLLFSEEREVLEYSNNILLTNIEYEVIKDKNYNFKTRNEIKIKNYINRKVNELIKNNEIDELEYLYLDCFNIKNPSSITNIFSLINKNWDNIYLKLYNLLKMTEIK